MKLEEMILVKEQVKNRTMNYLLSLDDFVKIHINRKTDSMEVGAQTVLELTKTLLEDTSWVEIVFSEHKRVEARFCVNETQLREFLSGGFDEVGVKTVLMEALCNRECLDKVISLGLRIDGSNNGKNMFRYDVVESSFSQGNMLHNLNGLDYRVLEKLSDRNLLLMDMKQGNMVVAIGATMYRKYPKGEIPSEDNQTIGLEWDHGVYLGTTPSLIDFSIIREKYGDVKEIETKEDFRCSQEKAFMFYKKITESKELEISVREAATNAMYDIFCTGRVDVFQNNLLDGKYDGGFSNITHTKKEMVR